MDVLRARTRTKPATVSSDLEMTFALPEKAIEAVANAVAVRVAPLLASSTAASPWLSGAQAAADYLGWPKARVYRWIRELPHYRAGGRLMFDAGELDAWVRSRCDKPERGEQPLGSEHGQELLRDGGVHSLRAFQWRSKPPESP